MRLLVDECLPRRSVELLAAHGHDVVHVSDLGLLGAPDSLVLQHATSHGRVVGYKIL
ncbi:MAG: DUF5615 family PIN-like protein [Angustibacter sp.]